MSLWPYSPMSGMTEALTWVTDVMPAYSSEQRIALSLRPRRILSHEYRMTPQQHEAAVNVLRAGLPGPIDVPEWQEFSLMTVASGASVILFDTTTGRYQAGGKAILWLAWNLYEVVTIDAVADSGITLVGTTARSWSNAVIAPVSAAYCPSGFELARVANTAYSAQAEWLSYAEQDLADAGSLAVTYRGDPLISVCAQVGSEAISDRLMRDADVVDNSLALPVYDTRRSFAERTAGLAFITTTAAELWALRVLLHTIKGRRLAFWVPTWNNALVLAANASSGAGSLVIRYAGLSVAPTAGDLFIRRTNGTVVTIRYSNAVSSGGGSTETLTLSGTLPSALTTGSIATFCRMLRVRLDADRVELQHQAPRICKTLIPCIEVPA